MNNKKKIGDIMGQRSQIIVRIPELYLNKNNPNNSKPKYLIFHNQWLYGFGFLEHLADILENYELIKDDTKEIYAKHKFNWLDYKEIIQKSITCANYKNPINIRNSHLIQEINEEVAEWDTVFNSLDNNNGYIFLNIKDNGTIQYDILNGLEDADEIKRQDIMSYLRLFYDDEKIKEANKQINRLIERLTRFQKTDYQKIKLNEIYTVIFGEDKTSEKMCNGLNELRTTLKDIVKDVDANSEYILEVWHNYMDITNTEQIKQILEEG